MAKYLKPQTPLQHQSGDYIYPITTVDQVITAKGERLNANLINVDLNESVESDTNINLVNNKPKAGFIYPLASDVVPEGFLLCDGKEYLRAEYPELFAAIGTMYGAGDGSTTFNVPNLQNNNMQPYTVNYVIATGKDTGVSVADIIAGAQALPLGVEFGGTDATNSIDARKNLGVDNYVVDKVIYGKGKNLLKNTAKNRTYNGLTLTVNDDGSVTLNGTATNTTIFVIGYISVKADTNYVCTSGNDLLRYSFRLEDGNTVVHDFSANNTYTPDSDNRYTVCIRVGNGATVNETSYPMIRLASETDDTYEPYYEGLKEVSNKQSMELLWENASPTSSFSAKTISVDLTNWEKILVFVYDTASDCSLVSEYGKKGHTSLMSVARLYNPSGTKYLALTRKFTVSDNGIKFTDSVISNGSAAINDNNTMVPVYIYGVKGVS